MKIRSLSRLGLYALLTSSAIRFVHAQQPPQTLTFHSDSDLNPLALLITSEPSSDYECGYYFTCPRGTNVSTPGPAIYKSDGTLVWTGAADGIDDCFDLRTQTLNGTEVMTMWVGEVIGGWGDGRAIILNSTYNIIHNFTATFPTGTDLHEFQIPPVTNSTALLTSYYPLNMDFSSVGGSGDDWLLECAFQEIDIATNTVLFSWNASAHVSLSDSYISATSDSTQDNPWDFFHINSVDKDADGNYLVSARHYHQIYKVDGQSGDVIWSLGGKTSSWSLCSNCNFEWQHFGRWRDNYSAISLFDNASNGSENDESTGRGMILDLDFDSMDATLRTEFLPLQSHPIQSQGNTELLPSGDWLLGWGSSPWISEYRANGSMIYSAALGGQDLSDGPVANYRAFKSLTWKAYPTAPPSAAILGTNVYVSWNGATEVQAWEALAGDTMGSLNSIANVSRTSFETNIGIPSSSKYVQLRAYGSDEYILGSTDVLSTGNGSTVAPGRVAKPPTSDSSTSTISCGSYSVLQITTSPALNTRTNFTFVFALLSFCYLWFSFC
ncbi:hypothetical protein JAAARDRAFT_41927 [Jaapia argillacea MUCL 33604]|uniref:ASST-domain-containing protein n=1 Tax=Jaapia argillacea MUCL 33604 TaxID=933084 RepID=A0A067P6T5_9AGAM|nr:hypothetical protein JAAARDRAFT_41927 [Jaapia argillacea MUCL 33604]